MKSPPVKITLTKVKTGFYRVTRIRRAIHAHISIPKRDRIYVGETLSEKEADLLCQLGNYEVTIQ